MIDVSKLTPDPWGCITPFADEYGCGYLGLNGTDMEATETDLDFIALARNAFAGDPEALAWWEANRKKSTQN